MPTEAPVSTASTVIVREKVRTVDESSLKNTRAKRESRRMRELEQAKFSLELLKVRATSGGATSPSDERRMSVELVPPATPPLHSPQGTPDSQSSKGSFELLTMDEVPPKASEEVTDSEGPLSPLPSEASIPEPNVEVVSTSLKLSEPHSAAPSAPTHPAKIENYLPTFYVPTTEESTVNSHRPADESQLKTEAASSAIPSSVNKPLRERRESTRRPVVVVISMQKETPLSEELRQINFPPLEFRDSAAQTGVLTPSPHQAPAPPGPVPVSAPQADQSLIEKLVRLNEEKEERQRNQQQQNEKEMMEQIRQQKEALEQQRRIFAQHEREFFEKKREEALHRIQQSRQTGHDMDGIATFSKTPRPSSLLIERSVGLIPHARTQSDSTAPSVCSPPGADSQSSVPHPQLPPPPAPVRDGNKEGRPIAEGWAPKLTLESRDGGRKREGIANKKPPSSNKGTTVSLTDKSSNIFFSPKDKVTFAK